MSRLTFLYRLYFCHIFRFSISWTLRTIVWQAQPRSHRQLPPAGYPSGLRIQLSALATRPQVNEGIPQSLRADSLGEILAFLPWHYWFSSRHDRHGPVSRSPRAGLYKGTETPPEIQCLVVTTTPNCL